MIRVKFEYRTNSRECCLLVRGHAGQADVGQDIVCASASILAYTLAQVIKAMNSHKDFTDPPVIELESGNATIICQAKDDYLFAELMHTFFVVQTGYTLLAHNYPQYVELITDGKA